MVDKNRHPSRSCRAAEFGIQIQKIHQILYLNKVNGSVFFRQMVHCQGQLLDQFPLLFTHFIRSHVDAEFVTVWRELDVKLSRLPNMDSDFTIFVIEVNFLVIFMLNKNFK